MAAINTRIVRRSNYLMDFKYGRDFIYNEALVLGRSILSKFLGYFRLIPIYLISKIKYMLFKSLLNHSYPNLGKVQLRIAGRVVFLNLDFMFLVIS